MIAFIEGLNTVIFTVCLFAALYGLVVSDYMMTCAFALFSIAFQQATEEKATKEKP